MNNFLVRLFHYFQKRKLLLWTALLLISAFCFFSASKLNFIEDISSFLPENESNKKINFAYKHLGAANKIVVNIGVSEKYSATDKEQNKETIIEVVEEFANYLSINDSLNHILNLQYEVNQQDIIQITDFLIQNMPYFLSDDDYARIDTLLTLQNIENQLIANKQLLLSPMGAFVRNILISDPLHFSDSILQGLIAFQLNEQYHLEDGIIFNKEETEAIVTITSAYPVSETANNKLLAADIENAKNFIKNKFENKIDISIFGAALVSITNADQIKKDSFVSITLALIFILVLLIYFFRNARSLFLIAISLLFGGIFAIGIIALFKGTISIIAVGIASIIIGIAVNYPIHFLAHYKHGKNKKLSIKEIANPMITGNITTVGAFLSLLFISSDAMKDLGLFASLLLIGTIFFVLIFLPHMLGKESNEKNNIETKLAFGKLASFAPEKNKWIIWSVFVLTFVFLFFSFQTSFESNMHSINYMTTEQRQQFDKLIKENDSGLKTIYCVSEGENIDAALKSYEESQAVLTSLIQQDYIVKESGIGNYLPSKQMQQTKINKWNNFWHDKRSAFLKNLNDIATQQNYNSGTFDMLERIIKHDYKIQNIDYFSVIYNSLGENYLAITPEKSMVFTILQIQPENQDFVENTLNSMSKNSFAFDNSSIMQRMINALSYDFNYVLYICGFIVFLFLLFSFGRIELSLMAFVPLAVAWIWILGIMNIFDIKFNIVNIILATFIFGQGDDYTIFVTEGLLYEYTHRKKMLASFKNSILLSSIIMFFAIGMLIFAKHPAMRSLAEVTIVGMMSVLLMAYIFPPLIFEFLTEKKGKARLMPITLWNFLKTIISFTVFLIGSIIITIAGFILITIGGKNSKNKLLYHKLLSKTFSLLAKLMIQVPSKVINPHGEDFSKPGVIICNHQSHIDLMYTLMLSPKIITLTNEWVWKSPFYGWIIRYADFLPVIDGIEEHIDRIEKLIKDGYSILIFPEGTRSPDCSIGRFKKGAFYLADKLNLDIIPLIIHGIGHVLPKSEFMLRKGQINVEIQERISPNDPLRKNIEINEISKNIRKYYQKNYEKLREQVETPEYFADLVYHNYIYKGRSIEQRAKRNLKKQNNYKDIISQLPNKANLLIINCGQGEFSLLCALVKKNLNITAIEKDTELLSIAKNCTSVPDNLFYSDNYENCEKYDIFVVINQKEQKLNLVKQINEYEI
ncbi:1-acyl-sn-glycerol-3-phosphate acyltransferase [Bacteroidales bacterium OttesenSCG-928-I21]|nr:1-acyl-sn-glycerol-3-phosphate acyltransferase [Bacteroidales bacterium OttesenSCG-928-I21]